MSSLGKAGSMDINRKSGEHGDALGICHQFDRFIKKALRNRIFNAARGLERELERFPIAPMEVIENASAPPYVSALEKNRVFLGTECIFIGCDELAEALDTMASRYKRIVELWLIERRSDEEISRITGLDKKTVIKYRCNALQFLRDEMGRRKDG